jgi:membrane-bound lytic murein transglycosylase D
MMMERDKNGDYRRRGPILLFLFLLPLFFLSSFVFTAAEEVSFLPPRNGKINVIQNIDEAWSHIPPPRQGHRSQECFTLDIGKRRIVGEYIAYYTKGEGRDFLNRVLNRARPFRAHIAKRIEEKGLPPELLYLPVVESAFRERAVSSSGAVGLWQFMLNSIEPYPIVVDEWRDDRRDFWKSTDAALDKLSYNYRMLGNDWLLALAAYNCGLGKVQRTIAAAGTSDFWELSRRGLLPRQTIRYVPKFLAVAAIASHPGRYGFRISWDEPIEWSKVPINGQISLPLLAESAGIELDLLEKGNAELFYGVTPPSRGDYALKVPADQADIVKKALTQRDAAELMHYTVLTIGDGDTLYAISAHFGIPIPAIIASNPGIVPERLRIGSRLIVPVIRETGPYKSSRSMVSEEELASFTGVHTVDQGETLWAIAKRYGTTPEAIAQKNGIAMTDTIYPGHRLFVPEIN